MYSSLYPRSPQVAHIISPCETDLTIGQSLGLLKRIARTRRENPPQPWSKLIKTPIQVYMLSLFFADLVQGLGQALSWRWLSRGKVVCSAYCTAQGLIQQIGDTAVALSTMAIALYTFSAILFRSDTGDRSKKIAVFFVVLIWLFVILLPSIEVAINGSKNYIAPTPYWCWIGSNYDSVRVGGEYAWFWTATILSVTLYVLIYLVLRKILVVEGGQIIFQKPPSPTSLVRSNGGGTPRVPQSDSARSHQDSAKEAFKMLLISVIRFRYKKKAEDNMIPSGAIFFADSLFAMSGVINVVLWLNTRPSSVLIGAPETVPDEAVGAD
ncbi:hypothetical protein BU17DRAFT_67633 [Hysterangium stoloniferum]|nr:hypothetical protein BU17DRAFT_67633 [Hysterangium stoloniferum]